MPTELNDWKLDTAKVRDGVWVDLPGGGQLRIAQWRGPRHRRAIEKVKARPDNKMVVIGGDESPVVQSGRKLELESMALGVLLDWRELTRNGQPVEYSRTRAVALLSRFPVIRRFVEDKARDLTLFV